MFFVLLRHSNMFVCHNTCIEPLVHVWMWDALVDACTVNSWSLTLSFYFGLRFGDEWLVELFFVLAGDSVLHDALTLLFRLGLPTTGFFDWFGEGYSSVVDWCVKFDGFSCLFLDFAGGFSFSSFHLSICPLIYTLIKLWASAHDTTQHLWMIHQGGLFFQFSIWIDFWIDINVVSGLLLTFAPVVNLSGPFLIHKDTDVLFVFLLLAWQFVDSFAFFIVLCNISGPVWCFGQEIVD